MPRRPRLAGGDLAYHVLNRRVGRLPLFEKPADYAAFAEMRNKSCHPTPSADATPSGRVSWRSETASRLPLCFFIAPSPLEK